MTGLRDTANGDTSQSDPQTVLVSAFSACIGEAAIVAARSWSLTPRSRAGLRSRLKA